MTSTPAAASGMHFEIDAAQPALARLTLRDAVRLDAVTRATWRRQREIFDGPAEREPRPKVVIVRGEAGHRRLGRGAPTPADRAAHLRHAASDEHRDGVTRFLDKSR